ncbi:MAG: hypothetical protein ACOCUU_01730 [Nanoarchaeota archaeon]
MNFQFYLEKLYDSENFAKFLKENPDAYPTSCFFEIDLSHLKNPKAKNQDKQHFDYYVPSINKLFSFKLEFSEEQIEPIQQEILQANNFPKLALNYSFDFDKIKSLIENEMQKQKISNNIEKMLFSLQKLEKDNKDYLIGTIFLSNLAMLKIKIDIQDMKITEFKKQSFMDMMNIFKKNKPQNSEN